MDKSKNILITFDQTIKPPASTGVVDPTAFTVTSMVELHVGANFFVLTTHTVQAVKIVGNQVELTITPAARLRNPRDTVRVQYQLSKGLMMGDSQPVRNFDVTFTPVDLIKIPNPAVSDTVNAAVGSIVINPIKVTYKNTSTTDSITATVSAVTIVLTKVGSLPL